MADSSNVLVKLKLLGVAVFGRDAKRAGQGLDHVGKGGRSAARGLQQTSREGTRAAKTITRVQQASRKATAQLRNMRGAAQTSLSVAARVAALAAGATGVGGGAAITQAADYEQAMAVVNSRLLTSAKNMQRLDALAMQLGATTNFSARDAAGAMGELAAQGFNTHKILRVLPGTLALAAASGTDLANAASIQTQTLNAFGLQARKAGYVADVLAQISNRSAADIDDLQESLKYVAPVAKASGQSLADMGAAVGLMSNVGIKGSQAGTTLRTAMVRLSNPTEKARTALERLHLKAGDLAGPKGLLSLPNIMTKISAGARGVSKNQRNAAIATIFGREALSGMVALVEKGPKKLKALSRALQHSEGASKRAADIQRNTVKGAFDNLTGSIETASIKLTKRYMPAVKAALNAGAGGVNAFAEGLSSGKTTRTEHFRDPMGKKRTREVEGSGAQKAGATVTSVVKTVAAAAQRFAKKAIPVVKEVITEVIDAIKPIIPWVQNVYLPLMVGIAKGVLSSVVVAFKIAVPIIKLLTTTLGWLGQKAEPIKGIIGGIGYVIGAVLAGPILKALSVIPKIGIVFKLLNLPIRFVAGAFRLLLRVIGRLVGGFVRGITFFGRFGATLTGGARKVILSVTNLIGGIIHRIETLPGRAAALAGRVVSRLADRLGGGVRTVVEAAMKIGKAIVDGIVKAIKSAPHVIGDALSSIVPGPVKDAVGGISGLVSKIPHPHLARGGSVYRSGWAVVGEEGPELARLPRGTTVYSHRESVQGLGGGGGRGAVTMAMPAFRPIVIPLTVEVDGKPIHRSVHRVEREKLDAR